MHLQSLSLGLKFKFQECVGAEVIDVWQHLESLSLGLKFKFQ